MESHGEVDGGLRDTTTTTYSSIRFSDCKYNSVYKVVSEQHFRRWFRERALSNKMTYRSSRLESTISYDIIGGRIGLYLSHEVVDALRGTTTYDWLLAADDPKFIRLAYNCARCNNTRLLKRRANALLKYIREQKPVWARTCKLLGEAVEGLLENDDDGDRA